MALVDLGCVSRTPHGCTVADANESTCYSFNSQVVVHTRKLEVVAGVVCTSLPSGSQNTQQFKTTDPPIGSLIANPYNSESTSVSEIASTNSGVYLRSAAEIGVAGGTTMVVSKVSLTSARPTVLEVCCGSAGLTRELGKFEIETLGIVHDRNRHFPKAKVLVMDLSSVCVAMQEMVAVWFGILCGTCNRAKDKLHPTGPGLFRTEAQPLGRTDVDLNTLQTGGVAMVDKANAIYRAMIRAIGVLQARKVPWAIENDQSLLWSLPEVDEVPQLGRA